ncbi:MAG: hypothetical protein LBK59_06505 [Bifidobacteriaceae bacterium]|jgi:hypothetical protein|nr:hypothetical protein [Bifidobacteriaceae bacterium]
MIRFLQAGSMAARAVLSVTLGATMTAVAAIGLPVVSPPAMAADGDEDAENPTITWAVEPGDANGPDERVWIELSLDAGATVTEHLVVRNFSKIEVTFKLAAADAYFTDAGRFNMLSSDKPSVAAGTWITVEPQVTVPAEGEVVVPFTVTVPENATPGDHPAGIAASVHNTSSSEDGGAELGLESRVGFRVVTRVTGEMRPEIKLAEVRGSYQVSWNPFRPGRLNVEYQAENTGNIELSFTDQVPGSEAVERGPLYPGESREVALDGIDAWPWFVARVELTVTPTVAEDGVEADPIVTTVSVTAIPWPQLTLSVGVGLILTAFLVGRRRSRARVGKLVSQAREEGRQEAREEGKGDGR